MKHCVILHLGSPSDWAFYAPYIARVPRHFDLFATYHHEHAAYCESAIRHLNVNRIELVPVENRGMDTGPFLVALQHAVQTDAYDVVLKIHTKTTSNNGPTWRTELLEPIIGSDDAVTRAVQLFENSHIGMVGAARWIMTDSPRHPAVNEYAASLGLPTESSDRFIAGTMFWARVEPIERWFRHLDARAVLSTMPVGKPYTNHPSPAHCLERLFGSLTERAGYQIIGL